jgi:hypothetical protein
MFTARRLGLVAVAAVLMMVASVGCSKSNDAASGPFATTAPLSKDALVTRANEICAAADKAITELADAAPLNNNDGQQAQDELRQVVAKITPIAQNAIDELKSLTPPAGDEAVVSDGLGRMQAVLDAAKANPSNQLNPIGIPDKQLYNYGLKSCFTTEA